MDQQHIYHRIRQLLSILFREIHEENHKKEIPSKTLPKSLPAPPLPPTETGSTKKPPRSRACPSPGSKSSLVPDNPSIKDRLLLEKNYQTLEKLQKAERGTYKVIIIPEKGLSSDKSTHQEILNWLHRNNILAYDPAEEVKALEDALHQ